MSFQISDAYNEAQVELNTAGQSVDITDYIQFSNDVNAEFMTQMKHPTSERMYDVVLYPGLDENPLPSDWLSIIDPERPYGTASPTFRHATGTDFTHFPYGRVTGYRFDRENGYLLARETSGTYSLFNGCDSLTENGDWAVSGDGSALTVDEEIYVQGTASLKFTITASGGTTTLTCTDMDTPYDMTDFLTEGRFVLDIGCPNTNTTALTSVRVRLGSDSSNYYEMTSTIRHRGDSIMTSFGKISFETSAKTTTGTPVATAIDYVQVFITHGMTGINGTYRLDDMFFTKGIFYRIPYYSRNNIKSAAGVYKQKITADDDMILCPTEMDGLYKFKILATVAKRRLQDTGLADEFEFAALPYARTLSAKYPSQEQRVSTVKYRRWNTF